MRDQMILDLVALGHLRVDAERGLVFAPRSNTPNRPIGAWTRKGYLRACINVDGRQQHFMVHRIVWVSAHGCLPDGLEINHRNTRKGDNRLGNLEAISGPANMAHAAANGLARPVTGARHHAARITAEQAQKIRDRLNAGEPSTVVAREYGVSAGHARRIAAGLRWRRELGGHAGTQYPTTEPAVSGV